MAPRYELAVGLRRGHKTTKIERVGKVGKELTAKSEKIRQSRTKGVSNMLTIFCMGFRLNSILYHYYRALHLNI